MKKVVLGIAIILFGFNLSYVAIQAEWAGVDFFGLCVSIAGLVLSLHSGLKKEYFLLMKRRYPYEKMFKM